MKLGSLALAVGPWSVFCFLVVSLAACNSGSASSSVADAGYFEFNEQPGFVAANTTKFVEVQARVNGVLGRFLIDTGADVFILSNDFANRLGLPIVDKVPIATISGTSKAEVREIELFELANVVGRGIRAVVGYVGNYDGVIGKPLLRQAVVLIDYQLGLVEIADASQSKLSYDESVVILKSSELITSKVESAGVTLGLVLIDTGFSGGLLLSESRVQHLVSDSTQTVETSLATANGKVPGTAFVMEELVFGGFQLTNQPVIYQASDNPVGLLGNAVLRQFVLGIDLSRSEVALKLENPIQYDLGDAVGRTFRFSGVRIEEAMN